MGIVGRDDCLRKLNEALDEVRAGTPVVALVHGGSGMGKTTLVRSFLEDLRRDDPDIVLLEGHCYEQEAVPYKALDSVVDALSQYLQGFSPRDVALYIPQDFDALMRLFPVLRRVDVSEEPKRPRIRDSQELRNRASRALRDLIGRLGARRLVVIAIDDLQWGDMDSKAILDDIFRPPRQPPLLLVASYRSEGGDEPCASRVRSMAVGRPTVFVSWTSKSATSPGRRPYSSPLKSSAATRRLASGRSKSRPRRRGIPTSSSSSPDSLNRATAPPS
ncbi:MAG: ATP-binding protein [Blastocatellia bacterium]|nr:ATP-binding protein [Blastocatellia bacterium]